jgi:hypothetical protein
LQAAQGINTKTLGFYMDMTKTKKFATILVCIALIAIIVGTIQNIWLKKQFEKNTNYYLNQSYVDALRLENNKNLLDLVQNRELDKAEKLLKILIKGQKEVIMTRLENKQHDTRAITRLNSALIFEPESCVQAKPNKSIK